ncbi:AAA family ATPase [Nonomuraea glycinis]|uniref:phosphatase domain-containing protein n=1 Tax=Nonomuraea glycinis TaxID=2047744 RepID=UPI0033A213EC
MSTLTLTRGLPGSGKSTWATAWVADDIAGRARINKDDLRSMVHNGEYVHDVTEKRINTIRDTSITALLKAGLDVVSDDTNLPDRVVRDLAKVAVRAGADIHVQDFTHVSLEECIRRDAARPRPVGEQVIRDMHTRYLKGRSLPLPVPDVGFGSALLTPYIPTTGLQPNAVLIDVDGTLALANGRNPYDESRVFEDLPNTPVLHVARAMYWRGWDLVIMSGRSEACRFDTERWLRRHLGVPFQGPHMRPIGDQRADLIVKAELFNQHVRHSYKVSFVLDNRASVVAMWRRLGLTVFQVAEGNF